MNKFAVQFNQVPKIIAGKQILKEGNQVLVRIISDKGNGKYEGSVAGVRVNITSEKKLVTGETFLASISTKDGKVFVSPKNLSSSNNLSQNIQIQNLKNEQISSILNQFNLPADSLTIHLFQQFQQLQMKQNPELLKKIRNISVKFNGKEKITSEILSIISEKGISATDKEILQIIKELEGNFDNHEDSNQAEKFSLMNKINKTRGKWYFVPFEIYTVENNNQLGNGNLKIMVDFAEQLKILNVDCNYSQKKFLFNLEFKNKKLSIIRFFVENANEKISIEKLKEKLSVMGITTIVEWTEKSLIEGTSCGTEKIMGVGGIV